MSWAAVVISSPPLLTQIMVGGRAGRLEAPAGTDSCSPLCTVACCKGLAFEGERHVVVRAAASRVDCGCALNVY